MGNRGLLHDPQQVIRRAFKLKAWITCVLSFKDRRRIVMSPGNYTELFFLDEATSFAAGHRPCFECRRERASTFKSSWLLGNPAYGFTEKTKIGEIDNIIHEERINKEGKKIAFNEDIRRLPNGAFIAIDHHPYVVNNGRMYLWTPSGYGQEFPFPSEDLVDVLTPRSIVNAFKAGYLPQINL